MEFPPPRSLDQAATGYPIDVLAGAAGESSKKKYWVQVTFGTDAERIERILTFPNVSWSNNEYLGH